MSKVTEYQTIGIYLPHSFSCPRESTNQEKLLINWAHALEYTGASGEELTADKYEMYYLYDEGKPIIMAFNSKGAGPIFRGETEAQCLDAALKRLKKKHDELSAKQTASQIAFDILQQKWDDWRRNGLRLQDL